MREEDCGKRRLWERDERRRLWEKGCGNGDEGRRLEKGIWKWGQRKKTVGNGDEGMRLCENG